MFRCMKTTIGLAALALLLVPAAAQAQLVRVYSGPPIYVAPPPLVNYSYYPAPATVYYQPAPVNYSYYAPPVSYSYYAPATTAYSAPAVYTPGVITSRSYYGLGIFRPLGWTTESYFTPAPVVAPVTSYYPPVFIR